MKVVKLILIVLIASLVGLALTRNVLVKRGAERAIEGATGFDMHVGEVRVGLLKSIIHIDDFKLFNPPDFKERVAMEVERIVVDYDLLSLLSDRVELSNMEIDIPRFVVVKTEEGESNTGQLRRRVGGASAKRFSKENATKKRGAGKTVFMKRLKVNLGKMEMHDYSRKTKDGRPVVGEYTLNVDREFKDVDGIEGIARIITSDVLSSFGRLGLDVGESPVEDVDGQDPSEGARASLDGLLQGLKK